MIPENSKTTSDHFDFSQDLPRINTERTRKKSKRICPNPILLSVFLPYQSVARVKYKGRSPKNEDLLSSRDVFSRTTETIPDLVDFSAGSWGDSFESSFQTFGCLVSRYGRLFVKLLRREEQGRNVALLMSEQTGTGTADGASPPFRKFRFQNLAISSRPIRAIRFIRGSPSSHF